MQNAALAMRCARSIKFDLTICWIDAELKLCCCGRRFSKRRSFKPISWSLGGEVRHASGETGFTRRVRLVPGHCYANGRSCADSNGDSKTRKSRRQVPTERVAYDRTIHGPGLHPAGM